MNADIIVIGAGLAGLVAAAEAADRGKSVIVLDREVVGWPADRSRLSRS